MGTPSPIEEYPDLCREDPARRCPPSSSCRRARAQLTNPQRQGLVGFEPTTGIADARPGFTRGAGRATRPRVASARQLGNLRARARWLPR